MRLTRKPSRFMVEITWYPNSDQRVDFVFHRRETVTAAEMERQRQAGVRDPSQFANVVIGNSSCPPMSMLSVQECACAWLERTAGADLRRDSFVFQNWTGLDRELVASRVGTTQAG
jgi:hypothetical protein